MNQVIHGDCLETLKTLEDNSIDAVVTDPPYGLSFMGKKWDYDVPSTEIWEECLRVLKPGGYLLAFAGTRTQHRMAVRIEDAGFEIRDIIAWVYGSGFPKSLNIGKAVDKLQGKEPIVIGKRTDGRYGSKFQDGNNQFVNGEFNNKKEVDSKIGLITKPATPEGEQWEGWGTALKPALEPITVARKPLSEKTVAENVLTHGTGGINIDQCRVGMSQEDANKSKNNWKPQGYDLKESIYEFGTDVVKTEQNIQGRFPANLIHDGSEEVVELFPETTSGAKKANQENYNHEGKEFVATLGASVNEYKSNSGSASRFFYCAKASKKERNMGCEELEKGCNHPTVKPIALMEYLVKLVSREGATVLDPFAGSGTTGIACKNLNRQFIGIEREADYVKIANARMANSL